MKIIALFLLVTSPLQAEEKEPAYFSPEQIEAMAPERCRGMVRISSGPFTFGDSYSASGKKIPPAYRPYSRPVTIKETGAFLIDKCEVTSRQLIATVLMAKGESPTELDKPRPSDERAAASWTLRYAETYCKYLGKRLPTEEEWEKAARGGTSTIYYWGDEFGMISNYEQRPRRGGRKQDTGKVAEKAPNPYGLYDMAGNAQEMTTGECWKGGSVVSWESYFYSPGFCFPAGGRDEGRGYGWRCVKDIEPAAGSEAKAR